MNNKEEKKEVKAKGVWKGLFVWMLIKGIFTVVGGLIMLGILLALLKTGLMARFSDVIVPGSGEKVEKALHPSEEDQWWKYAEEHPDAPIISVGEDGVSVFGGPEYSYDQWDQDLASMLGE